MNLSSIELPQLASFVLQERNVLVNLIKSVSCNDSKHNKTFELIPRKFYWKPIYLQQNNNKNNNILSFPHCCSTYGKLTSPDLRKKLDKNLPLK